MGQIIRLYSGSFLMKLLHLLEMFTSITSSGVSPNLLSMMQKVATPEQLRILLNLLVYAPPRTKFTVIKILNDLLKMQLPFEIFEETVSQLEQDRSGFAYEILNKIQPTLKFKNSKFLCFIHHYLLSIRQKMWAKSAIESQGQYAISCELARLLRFIYESQSSEAHPWRKEISTLICSLVKDYRKINKPREVEVLLSLIPGADFTGLAPYTTVRTDKSKE